MHGIWSNNRSWDHSGVVGGPMLGILDFGTHVMHAVGAYARHVV